MVRHGQPEWTPGGICVDDPGLTELGWEQAERIGATLAKESFDFVYVSPLKRAQQTASPIVERLEPEPHTLPWLAELGHRSLEGRPEVEAEEYFAALTGRDLECWWDGPPGGESFHRFDRRVRTGIEELLVEEHRARIHRDDQHRVWQCPERDVRLLIVAHGGTIGVLISYLFDLDTVPWMYERFKMGFGGISRVATSAIADGATWSLRAFNERAHLHGLPDPPG